MTECTGISIIWCAVLGFLAFDYRYLRLFHPDSYPKASTFKFRLRPTERSKLPVDDDEDKSGVNCMPREVFAYWWLVIAMLTGAITCVYYLFAENFITTVAHILAFAMGFLFGMLKFRLFSDSGLWLPRRAVAAYS